MPWNLKIHCILCAPSHYCQGKRKKKQITATTSITDSMIYGELSSISSVRNKDSVVRIVLASGMVEVYDCIIPAYFIIQKYPGLCLARPEVFKNPDESMVGRKEMLHPGQKFYLVPKSTVKKLQRKHAKKVEESEKVVSNKVEEETVCCAKDFYVENEKWNQCYVKRIMKGCDKEKEKENKMKKKKVLFVPPINKTRSMRQGLLGGWKPGLTSVEEE